MDDLIIVGDVHIAKAWDRLDRLLPASERFLNPNAELKSLVRRLKKHQVLVINGDLVDYHYADYDPSEEKNLNYADQILSGFDGMTLINVGNHDYRSYAYNFGIYGLHHVNVQKKTRQEWKERFGFHRFRWFKELRSIHLFQGENDLMSSQLLQKDYTVSLKERRLIFLDTGPDAFSRPDIFFNPRYWGLLLQIRATVSYGLREGQLRFLERELKRSKHRKVILFVHCPPLFSREKASIVLKPGKIYSQLRSSAFGSCMFPKNIDGFLRTLIKSDQNITVISSHTHASGQSLLSKKSMIMRTTTIDGINRAMDDKNEIKFVSTLPLGVLGWYNKKIGYLEMKKGKLQHVLVKDFSKNDI